MLDNSKLDILLDAGPSKSKMLSGIGQHADNLYLSLKKITDCKISTYSYLHRMPPIAKRLTYEFITNLEYLNQKYDILHFLTHYVPFTKFSAKKVVTIHDLIPFRCPETITAIWRSYNRRATKNSIERSDAIITLSNFVKNEILNLFPHIEERKIFICGGGLRDIFFKANVEDNELLTINIKPYNYFLFVGDLTTRKNLIYLIDSFKNALEKKGISPDTKLILTGKPAYGYSSINSKLISSKNIITLGYISDNIMVALYKYAKAFIFPSMYEGYGMVLLEAMSQNCPIIISNIAASIELNKAHNDQMFIFELEKPNQLSELIVEFDKKHQIYRDRLDYKNLDNYTYDVVARNHFKAYKKIIGF